MVPYETVRYSVAVEVDGKIRNDMAQSSAVGRKAIEPGPTAKTVARNMQRFRMMRGLTLAELSTRISAIGRDLSANTLSAIELMNRRADVDDLVSIAAALNVSPAVLLMPHVVDDSHLPGGSDSPEDSYVETSAERPVVIETDPAGEQIVTVKPEHTAAQVWYWLTAESPLDAPVLDDERDDVAVEMWRRETVPQWAYRARTHG